MKIFLRMVSIFRGSDGLGLQRSSGLSIFETLPQKQPELGAASQEGPPRGSAWEWSPLTHTDPGVQFLPAPAACLASALPTKPAPPRQAGSTINFNSKLFLFIIFKGSRPYMRWKTFLTLKPAEKQRTLQVPLWQDASNFSSPTPCIQTHTHTRTLTRCTGYSLHLWILFYPSARPLTSLC